MTELVWLIVGFLLGGCISTVILCCLQINRHNEYERELRKLKEKLNQN